MDNFVRMKAAMAMEKAAESGGEAGAGLGLGMGMMMPGMFGNLQTSTPQTGPEEKTAPAHCQECEHPIAADARFCPLLRSSAGGYATMCATAGKI